MFINTLLLIVIAVLVGLFRGGKLEYLGQVRIRYAWLVIMAFVVQFATIFLADKLVYVVDVVTYGAILAFALLNRKQISILLILMGLIMNFSAMLANSGRMPVYLPYAKKVDPQGVASLVAGTYGKQIAMSAHTHLNFLGDLFYIGHPFPNPTLLSAGDLVIFIGIFLFIQQAMVRSPRAQGETDGEVKSS